MTDEAAPVSTLRNIGPTMADWFARAGITNVAGLRAAGADAAYARLLDAGLRPHFVGYLAIAMGLEQRHWTDCRDTEKAALRARFDAIAAKAGPGADTGIDEALAAIGVVAGEGP